MPAANFLQPQTAAAHSIRTSGHRQSSKPEQFSHSDPLSSSSSSSSSTSSTSTSTSTSSTSSSTNDRVRKDRSDSIGNSSPSKSLVKSSSRSSSESESRYVLNHARCSRCQSSVATGIGGAGMPSVSFGMNLYYCKRCAKMVGFER